MDPVNLAVALGCLAIVACLVGLEWVLRPPRLGEKPQDRRIGAANRRSGFNRRRSDGPCPRSDSCERRP